MNPRELELALRRQRLQLKCASQRQAIAQAAGNLAPVFAAGDRVRAGYVYLKQHPEWVIGAAIVVAIAKPRALFGWVRRGVVVWQISRRVRRGADKLLTRFQPR